VAAARAASHASYKVDPEKKRATSHGKKHPPPSPMHMRAKAFLMLTGVPIQHAPSSNKFLSNTMHIYTYTVVTTSQKCPKTSYRKSTLPKSAKNKSW